MRKINILSFEIISTILIMVLGVLLHFMFEWSEHNLMVGIFSAVNESTWEHLKLLFFPMLFTTIIGYFYFKDSISNYLCTKTKGIIIALLFIVIFFYTYTGILGMNLPILDISSFFIAVVLGQYYAYQKMLEPASCNHFVAIIVLVILSLCFVIFTFFPPHIGIFEDPVTGGFGISNLP